MCILGEVLAHATGTTPPLATRLLSSELGSGSLGRLDLTQDQDQNGAGTQRFGELEVRRERDDVSLLIAPLEGSGLLGQREDILNQTAKGGERPRNRERESAHFVAIADLD
jgi:hypothetical protein